MKNIVPHKIKNKIVWLIENDLHTPWIIESKRLDHDQWLLTKLEPYLSPEKITLDIGAHIGTHTVFYAERSKLVVAFEPNPVTFNCLARNIVHYDNVATYCTALGKVPCTVSMIEDPNNAGASYVVENEDGVINQLSLDAFPLENVGFIKIDAEGAETDIIQGGVSTITKNRPTMLIEVNSGALERRGTSAIELYMLLERLNYNTVKISPHQSHLQFDLLCTPK